MPSRALRSVGPAVLPVVMVFLQCGIPVRQSSEKPSGFLDPQHIQIGEIIYAPCGSGGWLPGRRPPFDRPVVVDIYFSAPEGNLTPEQERNVSAHGGRVLYRFQHPIVRAEIFPFQIERVAAAGGLFFSGQVNHVRSVPGLERMDVERLVMYRAPVSESDLQRLTKLGARVKHVFTSLDGLSADIPDQSILALRSDPSVFYVGYNGILCGPEDSSERRGDADHGDARRRRDDQGLRVVARASTYADGPRRASNLRVRREPQTAIRSPTVW